MIYCFRKDGETFEVGYYTPAGTWVSKIKGLISEDQATRYVYYFEWGRPVNMSVDAEYINDARAKEENKDDKRPS